ncbi:LuxR C-terminal-related transcriptional regulator [Pectobacteriaceae bacterium CE90]|nr:LuxR family transcriptional regulator [Prodigiosinella sp. LS101]WJV52667.1 LuxR C-terminal-related transcriptional regulator [Prodigiosinella sp. LS101]WJV57021.1 LuxR C-terminal-related transcriptional regulator [Pectobacteriaceae bacterium C111]WJY16262.1 LuxR C-terminal-related transcriptional regulator [Pectobacteriaceae bacterium CE90]
MPKVTLTIQSDAFIYSCLENITRLIPGSFGAFYLVDEQLMPQQHILSGISKEMHQSYMREFLALDPLHPKRFNHQPVTFAGLDDTFRKTPYYHRFMKPYAIGDMNEIFVRKQKKIVAALSLMRDKPFTSQESMRLRATLPLIEVATAELLPSEAPQRLTRKEQEVVEMIREGACNKHIASHLNIALSTVKTHLRNIFIKTHASNRTELLRNVNATWYEKRIS